MAGWHKVVGRFHKALYEGSRGLLGWNLGGIPMLLLTTTGRRSGQPRTIPLAYVKDGRAYVIVASNAGSETPPLWWRNLEAEPRATVRVGPRSFEVRAREAEGAERERLWKKARWRVPFYAWYGLTTRRVIPVVVLERMA